MKNINVLHPVHKDVSERLSKINKSLAGKVNEVLLENKAERHIRGGMATREKYRKAAEEKRRQHTDVWSQLYVKPL